MRIYFKIKFLRFLLVLSAIAISQQAVSQHHVGSTSFETPQNANQISIYSDDVDETGLASAYTSHRFYIEKGNLPISNPRWTLELPLANGGRQSIQIADNNLSCTTSPIENESLYKINSNGEIEAQLKFTGTVNDSATEAAFKIHLELKPLIEYAVIERIEDNSPFDSYNAYYKVKCHGADILNIYVEEEYGSKVKYSFVKEPDILSGVADHITAPTYAWIDFIAENQYGKSMYTIELEPYGVVSDNSGPADPDDGGHHAGIDIPDSENEAEFFDVYDISGKYIGRFNEKSELENISPKGILIVKRISKNKVETFKFINK